MAGRKPLPSRIKELKGTDRADRMNTREPHPTGIPTCPKILDAEARKEWRRISKELVKLGLLTNVDRVALALYCQMWSRWCQAEAQIAKFGGVVKGPPPKEYPLQNPWIGIGNRAAEIMHKFISDFGMNPSARSRVRVPEGAELNEWNELFEEENGEDAQVQ